MRVCFCVFVVVVQLTDCVQLFATPWTVAHKASLSFHHLPDVFETKAIESGNGCSEVKGL